MKIRSYLLALSAIILFFVHFADAQRRTDVYAITNAKIVTVSGAVIEKGTIVVRDGLIEAVAADAKVPADARILDGAGLTVYPGFFDALTNLGIQSAQPQTAPTRGQGSGQTTQTNQSNSNYPGGLQPEISVYDQLKNGDAQFENVERQRSIGGIARHPLREREGVS